MYIRVLLFTSNIYFWGRINIIFIHYILMGKFKFKNKNKNRNKIYLKILFIILFFIYLFKLKKNY